MNIHSLATPTERSADRGLPAVCL